MGISRCICDICKKRILSTEPVIRMVIEEVLPAKGDVEPVYFSDTQSWNCMSIMHRKCVRIALSGGKEIPYEEEVRSLENVPLLSVVI